GDSGGSTGGTGASVLNLDDPASGTYVRDGILEVGSATLPGDITIRASDVAPHWPTGQATGGCSGPDNSEYAHTLYLAVGSDYKTTQYGCYPSNQWSSHDFDVTVFLANVAGEGVYPMYDISGPANDATSSYDNKTYIYLQLASNEAHTLYEVDSNYGLTSVIEVTDVNTNELTFFYHP
ncbi:hypothetical protein UB34_20960, partial [Photobacterium leiognathi]